MCTDTCTKDMNNLEHKRKPWGSPEDINKDIRKALKIKYARTAGQGQIRKRWNSPEDERMLWIIEKITETTRMV